MLIPICFQFVEDHRSHNSPYTPGICMFMFMDGIINILFDSILGFEESKEFTYIVMDSIYRFTRRTNHSSIPKECECEADRIIKPIPFFKN